MQKRNCLRTPINLNTWHRDNMSNFPFANSQ